MHHPATMTTVGNLAQHPTTSLRCPVATQALGSQRADRLHLFPEFPRDERLVLALVLFAATADNADVGRILQQQSDTVFLEWSPLTGFLIEHCEALMVEFLRD